MVHNGVVSLNNVRFDQIYLMTSNLFQAHVKRDVNLIVISYNKGETTLLVLEVYPVWTIGPSNLKRAQLVP